jgi:tRNA1Val (adenine37-N6)-methyltransferase
MKQAKDFRFRQFTISQERATHKVGTDGVLLGAWVGVSGVTSVLDIGTGTGLIALMLAQRTHPGVNIHGVEIQHDDAEQARINILQSPWAERMEVFETPFQNFAPAHPYDLIVSNPPFFSNSLLPPSSKRASVRHQDRLTFSDLLSGTRKLLKPYGRLGVILPYREGMQLIAMAETSYGLYCIRQCDFRTKRANPVERLLLEFSNVHQPFVKEQLLLYNDAKEWSEAYKKLTAEFYLNM